MSTLEEILNMGEINSLSLAMKRVKGGSLLFGEGMIRPVVETVDVETDSLVATPSYTILKLLRCKTVDLATAEEKTVLKQGGTPAEGEAAAASDGLSVVLNAESTGTGTALLVYYTSDPPSGAETGTASLGAGF